jgi:DNA polymerase-1
VTLALLDGDIIVWRASAPAQRTLDWDDGEGATLSVDPEGAMVRARTLVERWTAGARCAKPVVCLSDLNSNFRKALSATYKRNRGPGKPEAFMAVRKFLEDTYQSFTLDHLEADDTMGILHTSERYKDSVIVTVDKDLLGVPGRHFNPTTGRIPFTVKPLTAELHWMKQTLMGDLVDNIKGIPGVGPKTADTILAKAAFEPLWLAVVQAYAERGLTELDALLNARLTRILRRSDYDRDNQEVILWHPIRPERLALRGLTPLTASSSEAPNTKTPPATSSKRTTPARTSRSPKRSRST